jgi:hypothetical protein
MGGARRPIWYSVDARICAKGINVISSELIKADAEEIDLYVLCQLLHKTIQGRTQSGI